MSKNLQTAIFIDGDWLYAATKRINKKINFATFFNILTKRFGTNSKIHFYGAINSSDRKQIKFYNSLKKIGYIVHLKELIKRNGVFISKGLEIQLAVDVMQGLLSHKEMTLISGDGDFAPLIDKIIEKNITVSIIGLPFTIGHHLRRNKKVIFLNLEGVIDGQKNIKELSISRKKQIAKLYAPTSIYIEKGDQIESYLRIKQLMESAKKTVTLVDKYMDTQILDIIKLLKPAINITLVTYKTGSSDFDKQIEKLREKGYTVNMYKTKIFHDRFIGIDNDWWHSGHSFKDLGSADSMLNKITEKNSLNKLKVRIIRATNNS
ncbi:MAG: NYN domain-containing protein [Candidatus Gracilibacteria bacterium]